MIFLFHGSDTGKVRTKAFEWVAKARAKEPNLAYARLAREDVSEGALLEAASAGGLFVSRLLILLDDPFLPARTIVEGDESEDVRRPTSDVGRPTSHMPDLVEEYLDRLAASDNAIVILAPKLAIAKAKRLTAKAKLTYVFDLAHPRESARGFNSALVNALVARAGEKLWLEIVRALRAGDSPEMLHGLLHWKARDIMEKGSRAWKPQEARALSLSLISLAQASRRKSLDLSQSLERFALSI
ncbi:MAG: hypothetical protein Q8P36_01685 [bacterium]|nr:hypothetical protein [bacterium]